MSSDGRGGTGGGSGFRTGAEVLVIAGLVEEGATLVGCHVRTAIQGAKGVTAVDEVAPLPGLAVRKRRDHRHVHRHRRLQQLHHLLVAQTRHRMLADLAKKGNEDGLKTLLWPKLRPVN